jgi:hypothetical protein
MVVWFRPLPFSEMLRLLCKELRMQSVFSMLHLVRVRQTFRIKADKK